MKPGEDTKEVDKDIKNKWRWAWINEIGSDGKPFGSWCQKLSEAGTCFCTLCARRLIYATSGKKLLSRHESDAIKLLSVPFSIHHFCWGLHPRPTFSMTDHVADLKIYVCSFVAEQDLSFTMAEPIVSLAKKLARNKIALTHMSLSRQHASYYARHLT